MDLFFFDIFRFINLNESYFSLWIQFSLITVAPIILIALGFFLGVDSVTFDQANKTLDLIFPLPIDRTKYILIRISGSIFYIIVVVLIGFISTYISSVIAGFEFKFDPIFQIWFVIFLQTLLALFIGSFLGVIYFNKTFGLQLSLLILGLSYTLFFFFFIIENVGFQSNISLLTFLVSEIIKIAKILSIFSYVQYIDFLFIKNFRIEALFPLILGIIIFFLLTITIFRSRDIIDSDLPMIYNYFLNYFSKDNQKANFSFSRIFTYWSLKLRGKYPILADELWSKGVTITIFGSLIFLSIFLQLILYPGDSGTQGIIDAFEYSPFYILFARGYNLSEIPYLGYIVAQLFAFLPLMFLPYIVYSFIFMELRDQNKTEELLLSYPVTYRSIFIWRSISAIIEYYLLVLIIIVSLVISELLINQLNYTLLEFGVLILSGPLYISIGFFLSLISRLFGKKGAFIGILLVFFSLFLYFIGSLTDSLAILTKITPYYYFDPVKILFQGIQLEDIYSFFIFFLISIFLVFIRLRKDKKYLQTNLSFDSS